jgi:hypothetical protein
MQAIASAFPAPEAIERLRRYGVRYVVVHGGPQACLGSFGPDEMRDLTRRLPAAPGVRRVITAGDDRVVELEAAAVDRNDLSPIAPVVRDVEPCPSN